MSIMPCVLPESMGTAGKRTLKVNYSLIKGGATYFECPAPEGRVALAIRTS